MDTEFMEKIGFSKKEATAYISLLKLGPATATQIAYDTGIDRTLLYTIFERLLDKGVISFSLKENVKHFNALNPKTILEKLKEKEELYKKNLPELETIYKKKIEKPKVEIMTGTSGIKSMIDDVLREGKDYVVYGALNKFDETVEIKLKSFLNEIARRGIKERLLFAEGEKALTCKTSEMRYLPKDMSQPSTNWIYGNKMAIIIWSEPITIILIQDKDVVESHLKHFEFMWKNAKK